MTELSALLRSCRQWSRAEGFEKTGGIMGTSTAQEAQKYKTECRGGSGSAWLERSRGRIGSGVGSTGELSSRAGMETGRKA